MTLLCTNRKRNLPLRLRKDYQRQLTIVKKYASVLKRQKKDLLSQIIPESPPEETTEQQQDNNVISGTFQQR